MEIFTPNEPTEGDIVLQATPKLTGRRWFLLGWLLVPLLMWWALREVPFQDIFLALSRLQLWQIAALLGLNLLLILLMTSRWWLILRSLGETIPYLALSAYRLAGFGVGYFTPGPQVGGEPLQVLLLQRRQHVITPIAVSSVFLDKLLELLSNFTFLVVGMLIIAIYNLGKGWLQPWMWPVAFALLLVPGAHLLALWQGRAPFTALIAHLPQDLEDRPLFRRIHRLVQQSETQIIILCREHPLLLLQTIGVSIVIWAGMVIEYLLVLHFIGLNLSFPQAVLTLSLSRLAFLAPFPGGLGTLEASQVLAMTLLGYSPATGISISLLIRARDLLVGLAGLWLGSRFVNQSFWRYK